jgi:hypothetical protein
MAFTADTSGSKQKGIRKATEYLATASDTQAAAIAAAVANPDSVTFNAPVAINGTGYISLGHTLFTRLHELSVKASVADSIIVYTADDAAGTNKVELARWGVAATGGPWYPFRAQTAGCLVVAASGKYLLLYAATATVTGFAITSSKAT